MDTSPELRRASRTATAVRPRTAGALLLALIATVTVAALSPLSGQQGDPEYDDVDVQEYDSQRFLSLEGRGGLALPVGDLADITDLGPTAGVGLAFYPSPRFGIRVDGDWQGLGSGEDLTDREAPDIDLWHATAGLELGLTDSRTSSADVSLNLGGGFTVFDAGTFENAVGQLIDFSETYFHLNGGVRLGTSPDTPVGFFVSGQAFVVFTEEEDTSAFSEFAEGGFEAVDTAISFPLTAGIRLNF